MSERDVPLQMTLDQAVETLDRTASDLGCRFVITDFGVDHRSGHIEQGGLVQARVILMSAGPRAIARVDVRGELGWALAAALEDIPAP